MSQSISYKLEKADFDGPLDLLLHLIEKDKIDIYDIPIAEITAQYMDCIAAMESEDLDGLSDFLVMACTLLEIKSSMLLPKEKDEEGEEIDPREALVERLLEYKRFKHIARDLKGLEEGAARYIYAGERLPEEVNRYVAETDLDELLEGVDADRLVNIFRSVLKRREYKIDTVRSRFGVIQKETIPLRSCIEQLIRYARANRRFSFRQILRKSRNRMEVIANFLAILELTRAGRIRVDQPAETEDIQVMAEESIFSEEAMEIKDLVDA